MAATDQENPNHDHREAAGGNTTLLFGADTFFRTRDGADPFAHILPLFGKSHVCLNLETSLAGNKKEGEEKNVSLCVSEQVLGTIPAQVRLVSIVNNHAADGASPARLAEALQKRGKTVIGPDNPAMARASVEGVDVDFISAYVPLPRGVSYAGSIAPPLEAIIRSSRARRRVVNLHWGYEHTDVPAPFQRSLARRLVDAGADVIIGHHPHVPQGCETYRGATIYYSLGNFNFWQFDAQTTEKNRWGYMVRYDLKRGSTEVLPYRVNENYQPVPASGREKAELLARLDRLSEGLRTVDSPTWFAAYYRKWFNHEFHVWTDRCRQAKTPRRLLQFMVWLALPMQIRFYSHRMAALMRGSRTS